MLLRIGVDRACFDFDVDSVPASSRLRFTDLACSSAFSPKLHSLFGASPEARAVDGVAVDVLFGVGEKKETRDAYRVFPTGVMAARAGVGGGSYLVLFLDGVAAVGGSMGLDGN